MSDTPETRDECHRLALEIYNKLRIRRPHLPSPDTLAGTLKVLKLAGILVRYLDIPEPTLWTDPERERLTEDLKARIDAQLNYRLCKLRRTVSAHALIDVDGKHLYLWWRLGTLLGAGYKAVRRWYKRGLDLITAVLKARSAKP